MYWPFAPIPGSLNLQFELVRMGVPPSGGVLGSLPRHPAPEWPHGIGRRPVRDLW